MKFKKVLSLALGAIMALSVSVTALAADTTQYYGVFYKDGSTDVSMTTNVLGQYDGHTITIDEDAQTITMPVYEFKILIFNGGLTSITDVDSTDGVSVSFDGTNIVVNLCDEDEMGSDEYNSDNALTIDDLKNGAKIDCDITYWSMYEGHTTSDTVDFGLSTSCPEFINPMG